MCHALRTLRIGDSISHGARVVSIDLIFQPYINVSIRKRSSRSRPEFNFFSVRHSLSFHHRIQDKSKHIKQNKHSPRLRRRRDIVIDELAPLRQHQRNGGVLVARPVHQQRHEARRRQRRIGHHRAAHLLDAVRIGGRQKPVERRLGGAPARPARIVAGAVQRAIPAAGRRTDGHRARRTQALQRGAAQRDARRRGARVRRKVGGKSTRRCAQRNTREDIVAALHSLRVDKI